MGWWLRWLAFWALVGFWITLICSASQAADFKFGVDTYEKWDDILIVNSLGDKVEESKFKTSTADLGYNDYIPENAFKNDLHLDGYTKVYDDKPTNGTEVVEVGYMGRLGDPRAYDADYVLKTEYDKYSAQSQDVRIDTNKSDIVVLKDSVASNTESILTNISNISNNAVNIETNRENIALNSTNIANNTTNIATNTVSIDKNTTAISNNGVGIAKNAADILVSKQDISTNTTNISNNEQNIARNFNSIQQNSSRINELDGRVSKLEETQFQVEGEAELYDTKYFKISAGASYDARHQRMDRLFGKVTVKLCKSYELKQIEKLRKDLGFSEDE